MLSGMSGDPGGSLFSHLSAGGIGLPDADTMVEQMERAQRIRHVALKEVRVESYDLSNEGQHAQYVTDLEHILLGVNRGTHWLMGRDKQFIHDQLGARWMAHLEWVEFEVKEKGVAPVPSARDSEQQDGKDSQD